jgi:hypothetical protein
VPSEGISRVSVFVVMGVSGSGKTTVGALLAGRLQWEFEDGDRFHPRSNVDKMQAGTPLTDQDRRPWLAAIAEWIDDVRQRGGHAVVACSALKRRYRDVLIGNRPDVRLIYLQGGESLGAWPHVADISCPRACCTASSRLSRSPVRTRTRLPSRSRHHRAKWSSKF